MHGTTNAAYEDDEGLGNSKPEIGEFSIDFGPQKNGKENAATKERAATSPAVESEAVSTVDFETALDRTGYGKFNYLILLLAMPATCASNLDTSTLSFAFPTASCDLKLTSYDRGILNGTIYAGMIGSAFLWGYLSDTYGRKRLLTIGFVLDSICSMAVGLSNHFWSILIFKFLSGFFICGPHSIFMAYISEVFNRQHRNRVILITGIFTAAGSLSQPLLAWAIIPKTISWTFFNGAVIINSWRLFLMIFALPPLVAGILCCFSVESPKYLFAQGRKEEAMRILRIMYSVNTGLPPDTYPVKDISSEGMMLTPSNESNNDMNKVTKNTPWEQVTGLFRKPYLCKALMVFTIQFGGLLVFNTIRLWLPQMFYYIEEAKKADKFLTICGVLEMNYTQPTRDCDNVKVDSSVYIHLLYMQSLTLAFFTISSYVVKFTGKKALLFGTYFISAVATWFIPWVQDSIAAILAAVVVALLNTCAVGLLGCVVALFPTTFRTMAVSLTMMFGRMGVVLGNASFPYILNYKCWLPFMIYGCLSFLCAVLMLLIPPATKKPNNVKTVEENKTEISGRSKF